MMASGQYQAQMGENENAKSGVAINARQRQGDRATYHFIDNQAIAIRFTGKQLVNLIPKVYDTPRIKKILAQDGNRINVKIDTDAPQELQNTTDPNNPPMDNGQKITEYVFNPEFGQYDIQADTGPSFATKRMETTASMMELIKADPEIMKIGGDLLVKNMDFAGADTLAIRLNNTIPPQIKGGGLPPEVEQMMHKSADMIQQLQGQVGQLTQQLKDKEKDLAIKAQTLDLDLKREIAVQAREDYKAETDRVVGLGNSENIPGLEPVIKQLIRGMLANGELSVEGGQQQQQDEEEPPIEGARKAPDGNWYTQTPEGGYARVDMQ